MLLLKSFASGLGLYIVLVAGHGIVTTPTPRAIGNANLAACGTGANKVLKSVESAITHSSRWKPKAMGYCRLWVTRELWVMTDSTVYGPIENAAAKVDAGYNATSCHLFFCRGLQFEDNKSNTRVYKPGTVVPFHVDIEAHHTGYANVSVVNLATQKPIGAPLFLWPVYTNNSLGPADWVKNETDFSVTIPDLGTQCSKGGACAIQWFWYAYNVQTYQSCVDFTTA
ncbi:hypothetical protein FPV67DRAFT_1701541 [Lyophyllum atratum]|nr:hypothetical protein FPV67DRAFT_1701541 [Lyophyllum atratum]